VVQELLGSQLSELLATPNNNLGVEYIRALNALGSPITPMTVRREGAAHNSLGALNASTPPRFVSATAIRDRLLNNNWDWCESYLVPGGREVLERNCIGLPVLEQVERAMLARLRTMTAEDWAKLPDSGEREGLTRRLEQAGQKCTSVEEFFTMVKTKRYTRARLERLALWAYLGLSARDVPDAPPYLRVLGFNERGRVLLKEMKHTASLPILTKPAHARELDEPGRRLFELEARCTDLYDLCFPVVPSPGREWTTGPAIL
jgi:predicted nucleotidyltransferase